jgi:hypothetical protein
MMKLMIDSGETWRRWLRVLQVKFIEILWHMPQHSKPFSSFSQQIQKLRWCILWEEKLNLVSTRRGEAENATRGSEQTIEWSAATALHSWIKDTWEWPKTCRKSYVQKELLFRCGQERTGTECCAVCPRWWAVK